MMKRVLGGVLVLAVLGYVIFVGLLYVNQDRLVFAADPQPDDVGAAGVPGLVSVPIAVPGGPPALGWYLAAPPGAPTLVYLHGNAGNLMTRLDRVRRLSGLGWGVMFLEYPGYGGVPGAPSQGRLDAAARAALMYLASRGVPSGRIVLYGESLGTGVAVRLATEMPVGAVVLDSPYTSIAAVAQGRYPFVPVGLLIRNPFPLRRLIANIHAPLLIMQGAQDQVVPPAMGGADFAAAAPPKQFWRSPTAGHDNVLESGGLAVMQGFVGFALP
jgi:pimeloyl-ACP methyl ester carboxylesterase